MNEKQLKALNKILDNLFYENPNPIKIEKNQMRKKHSGNLPLLTVLFLFMHIK